MKMGLTIFFAVAALCAVGNAIFMAAAGSEWLCALHIVAAIGFTFVTARYLREARALRVMHGGDTSRGST
jgi:hypothetical protein